MGIPLWDALLTAKAAPGATARATAAIEGFAQLMLSLRDLVEANVRPSVIAEAVLEQSKLGEEL